MFFSLLTFPASVSHLAVHVLQRESGHFEYPDMSLWLQNNVLAAF